MKNRLDNLLKDTAVYDCLSCGKCTTNCPLAIAGADYSPRKIANRAIMGQNPAGADADPWSCLTCGACEAVCPAAVDYTGFVRRSREVAQENGDEGRCSHSGIFQSLPRLHTSPDLKQDRLGWITPDLEVSEQSEIALFVGCAPYYDAVFENFGVSSTASAKGAIRLLNRLGFAPMVLADERCCGHDALWNGDHETFEKLAEQNVAALEESGAETVLTTCPECFLALGQLYPKALGNMPFEARHFYDFLLEHKDRLEFQQNGKSVTFHDPCRLARHAGECDSPRDLIALAGKELGEMPRSRQESVCCGTAGWSQCSMISKQMQRDRLREAAATGADTLVTACPKCLIHLSCADHDESTGIALQDLTALLSDALPET